jgi:hypothetical protein
MRDHGKKVEKSPEMKAYRKQVTLPLRPQYSKEDIESRKKCKEKA